MKSQNDRARAHFPLCHPMPTTSTATDAKCDKSCDGVCGTAEIGCMRGLNPWQRHVERKLQGRSLTQQQPNGARGTEEAKGTGGSLCIRCAVGQGRECECREPMALDRAGIRIVLGGLFLFWSLALVTALTKGCTP